MSCRSGNPNASYLLNAMTSLTSAPSSNRIVPTSAAVIRLAVLLAVLATGCASIPHFPAQVHYEPDNVLGNWVGLTDWDAAYYRLILSADQSGRLVMLFGDQSVANYEIDTWRIEDGTNLVAALKPTSSPLSPSLLHCQISKNHLAGEVRRAGGGGWREAVVFRREQLLLEALDRLMR